jgi:hypothetical protein
MSWWLSGLLFLFVLIIVPVVYAMRRGDDVATSLRLPLVRFTFRARKQR